MSESKNPVGVLFSSRLPASSESLERLASLWQEIAALLLLADLESQWLFEVELCFVEVVTNAIKHGGPTAPESMIELRASVTERVLELVVTDHGPGLGDAKAVGELPSDPMAECGRGLAIVRALIPDMVWEHCEDETRVTLRRPLPPSLD